MNNIKYKDIEKVKKLQKELYSIDIEDENYNNKAIILNDEIFNIIDKYRISQQLSAI